MEFVCADVHSRAQPTHVLTNPLFFLLLLSFEAGCGRVWKCCWLHGESTYLVRIRDYKLFPGLEHNRPFSG